MCMASELVGVDMGLTPLTTNNAARRFLSDVLPYFDANPMVERYSWFSLRAPGGTATWLMQPNSAAFTGPGYLYHGLQIPPPSPPPPPHRPPPPRPPPPATVTAESVAPSPSPPSPFPPPSAS